MKTVNEIRKAAPFGFMTMVSGTNEILFENGVKFDSVNGLEKKKLWDKLVRMGYEYKRASYWESEEVEGLSMAAANGENPFKCSIICSNPSLNESCK
jgi:hypothetical protein